MADKSVSVLIDLKHQLESALALADALNEPMIALRIAEALDLFEERDDAFR